MPDLSTAVFLVDLKQLLLLTLFPIYRTFFNIPPLLSVSLANIKGLINIFHLHAPVVGNNAHQTLADVADLVVVV